MPHVCQDQFNKRFFGFYCDRDEKESFFVTQWSSNRWIFLVYRACIWVYQISWLLAYYIYFGINFPDALTDDMLYITQWSHIISSIYFTLALILTAVGFKRRHEIVHNEHFAVNTLRSATWLTQTLGQTSAIIVSVVFWTVAISIASSEQLSDPFNVDLHAMNSVLYLIDIFVVASPIRLLHVIYVIAFAVIYIITTLIFHATGIISAVYPMLDWQNNPGLAAGLSIGLCFLGTTMVHSFVFGLHLLRCKIADKCCLPRTTFTSPHNSTFQSTEDSVGYEHEIRTFYIKSDSEPII